MSESDKDPSKMSESNKDLSKMSESNKDLLLEEEEDGEKNLDNDKKIGISLFALDGILFIVSVIMLVTTPSCEVVELGFGQPKEDFSAFNTEESLLDSHQSPPFNQFDKSPAEFQSDHQSSVSETGSNYNESETYSSYGETSESANPFSSSSSDIHVIIEKEQPAPIASDTMALLASYPYGDIVDMIPEDMISNPHFQCGVQKIKPNLRTGRVYGGSDATPHSWPWTIQLQINLHNDDRWGSWCGGTIITPRHIISAFHCFKEDHDWEGQYMALVGKHRLGGEYVVEFAKVRMHPEATLKETFFDMALVTTKTDMKFSDKVQPACLPPSNRILEHGTRCWAYGWGETDSKSSVLQQVDLAVVHADDCDPIAEVCAGNEAGKSTCQGDSGGPLTCHENGKWVLYGATSHGRECGSGYHITFASVAAMMPWFCCYLATLPACRDVECDPLVYY